MSDVRSQIKPHLAACNIDLYGRNMLILNPHSLLPHIADLLTATSQEEEELDCHWSSAAETQRTAGDISKMKISTVCWFNRELLSLSVSSPRLQNNSHTPLMVLLHPPV